MSGETGNRLPYGFMLLALLLLAVPGLLYNNLNNSGLVNNNVAQTCSSDPSQPICQLSANVGCQANAGYCSLSGQTISFLNFNSPFTSLLTGNILGFFSSLFTTGGLFGSNNVIYSAQPQFPFINYTEAGSAPWHGQVNKGYAFCIVAGTGQSVVTNPISPFLYDCNIIFNGYNPTTGLGSWTGVKCNPSGGPHEPGCAYIDFIKDPFGGTPGNPANWVTNGTVFWLKTNGSNAPFCPVAQISTSGYQVWRGTPVSYAPNATYTYKFDVVLDGCTQTTNNTLGNPFNWLGVLGFVMALALLVVLSLGINISGGGSILATGTNFALGSNRQGTKFAQVLLVGLVVWIPFYSEFSVWFTSGVLPVGLDGSVGIVSILLTGLFFFGAYLWGTHA